MKIYLFFISILHIVFSLKIKNLRHFFENHKTKGRILILELYPFHFECISGFAKYFLDLGFNVDIIFKGNEDYFYLFKQTNNITLYIFHKDPEIFYNKEKIIKNFRQYEIILFNTGDCFFTNKYCELIKYLLNELKKQKIFITIHNINNAQFYKEKKNVYFITLKKYNKYTYINPNYFGEINYHSKNNITTFLVIGNIEKQRRNYDLLMKTAEMLNKINKNFLILIIGKGKLSVPNILKNHIKILGGKKKKKQKDLIKIILKGDYIISLLDPKVPSHREYLYFQSSGNFQLSYGFFKPIIINSEFAQNYPFSSNNSIIYNNNELESAMTISINSSKDEYETMRNNLINLTKKIYNESLTNIVGILKSEKLKREKKYIFVKKIIEYTKIFVTLFILFDFPIILFFFL